MRSTILSWFMVIDRHVGAGQDDHARRPGRSGAPWRRSCGRSRPRAAPAGPPPARSRRGRRPGRCAARAPTCAAGVPRVCSTNSRPERPASVVQACRSTGTASVSRTAATIAGRCGGATEGDAWARARACTGGLGVFEEHDDRPPRQSLADGSGSRPGRGRRGRGSRRRRRCRRRPPTACGRRRPAGRVGRPGRCGRSPGCACAPRRPP